MGHGDLGHFPKPERIPRVNSSQGCASRLFNVCVSFGSVAQGLAWLWHGFIVFPTIITIAVTTTFTVIDINTTTIILLLVLLLFGHGYSSSYNH